MDPRGGAGCAVRWAGPYGQASSAAPVGWRSLGGIDEDGTESTTSTAEGAGEGDLTDATDTEDGDAGA